MASTAESYTAPQQQSAPQRKRGNRSRRDGFYSRILYRSSAAKCPSAQKRQPFAIEFEGGTIATGGVFGAQGHHPQGSDGYLFAVSAQGCESVGRNGFEIGHRTCCSPDRDKAGASRCGLLRECEEWCHGNRSQGWQSIRHHESQGERSIWRAN